MKGLKLIFYAVSFDNSMLLLKCTLFLFVKGDGTGVMSIYGEVAFADENFKQKHISPGLLSMVGQHRFQRMTYVFGVIIRVR